MAQVISGAQGYVTDVGMSGIYDSYAANVYEHVPALQYPQSIPLLRRMATDDQIKGILAAYTLPIRRAQWAVDPAGCRSEVVQLVADDLDLMVVGKDKVGSARRRGVSWAEHIRVALESLVYGHFVFEPVYELRDGLARLIELAERLPQTIEGFRVDQHGKLIRIDQKPIAGVDPIKLPPERFQLYTHDRVGAQFWGESLLRGAYKPWLLKDEMLRVNATSHRRYGVGVTVVKAPPNAQPNQIREASALASQYRGTETGGIGLPNGFEAAVQGITGNVPDTLEFIRYLDQQMSRSTLTGLLDLGSTPNGSRALGDTFLDLLMFTLQAIADTIAAQLTSQTVTNLVTLNFGEDEAVPRIVCGGIGAEHAVTAESLNLLLTSGALSTDPALEAYVRREWKLPERDPDAPPLTPTDAAKVLQNEAPVPVPPSSTGTAQPTTVPTGDPVAASRRPFEVSAATGDVVLRRGLTEVEAASGTDFVEVQEQWLQALDQLTDAWGDVTFQQRAAILAQIRAAVEAGDLSALAAITAPTAQAVTLLMDYMRALGADAAEAVVREATSQGVKTAVGVLDDVRIEGAAKAVAGFLASGLATSAGRSAMLVWNDGASPKDVEKSVGDALDELTDASLRDGLGGALSVAQNEGRAATLKVAPKARYYSSEVLDANTCQPCRDVDGMEFDSLDEGQAAYASGGFRDCKGGLRCRGIIVTRWEGV